VGWIDDDSNDDDCRFVDVDCDIVVLLLIINCEISFLVTDGDDFAVSRFISSESGLSNDFLIGILDALELEVRETGAAFAWAIKP
jgi:hypothetical protein